jgi:hypothetical protein
MAANIRAPRLELIWVGDHLIGLDKAELTRPEVPREFWN